METQAGIEPEATRFAGVPPNHRGKALGHRRAWLACCCWETMPPSLRRTVDERSSTKRSCRLRTLLSSRAPCTGTQIRTFLTTNRKNQRLLCVLPAGFEPALPTTSRSCLLPLGYESAGVPDFRHISYRRRGSVGLGAYPSAQQGDLHGPLATVTVSDQPVPIWVCACGRIRTCDLPLRTRLLYPLSYVSSDRT